MAKLVILGSSNAVASENHENTHMVYVGEDRMVLIDTIGNSVVRLKQAGLDPLRLTDVVLTHFHPDHISGISLLLMTLWLLGRREPLNLIGLEGVLANVRKVMGFAGWEDWPDFYPVNYCPVSGRKKMKALSTEEFELWTAPVQHFIENIAVRMDIRRSDRSFAYSSDTEPCASLVDLAQGVDVLIHEATGESPGHSTAAEAGVDAAEAGAGSLYLIHYPTWQDPPDEARMRDEAGRAFSGPVVVARDFMEIPL